MYESHWGLRESPFRDRLDPQFFYPSTSHEESLARLEFLIEQRRRLGLLLGGTGSGKSLLLEVLAAQLQRSGPFTARINLIGLEGDEMLHALLGQLGRWIPRRPSTYELSTYEMWRMLLDRLAEFRYQHMDAVLIFDDADRATASVLPHLLRLAKLEFVPESRLTIIMSSNPDRLHRLGSEVLSLAELRIDLLPWTSDEIEMFLKMSLDRVGQADLVFETSAVERLSELSEGIPRQVRQMADLALLAGAGQGLNSIDADVIDAVYDELTSASGYSSVQQMKMMS
jgi:type II secretory pathway predicted ATPase ExeA